MPTIAIVGTAESGKTVLITTLEKQLACASNDSLFLNSTSNDTIRYVERNWRSLCAGQWAAGSPITSATFRILCLCSVDRRGDRDG